MAAGQLVSLRDLALAGHINADELVHTGGKVVESLRTPEHLYIDNLAGLAVRYLERGVADLTGLLTENGSEQALLGGHLGFSLGGHLAYQVVTGAHIGAHPDDALII